MFLTLLQPSLCKGQEHFSVKFADVLETVLYSEFYFDNSRNAFEAFKNIGLQKGLFVATGLTDFKMMGSGSGTGFSLIPNLRKYAIFFFFTDAASAKAFTRDSAPFQWYLENAESYLLALLKPQKAHGTWSGRSPFGRLENPRHEFAGTMAVITRATIRPRAIIPFWKHVPRVAKRMSEGGALHQAGVGEYPIFMQATFSIWPSEKSMLDAAYGKTPHADAVKNTRRGKWFKEELFARFEILNLTVSGTRYKKLEELTFPPV